jgi:6-pyruvoyltetrahydropterin/6-carboxytetrahydropterin synthase
MAHRLFNLRESRCYIPHGHNEYVTIELTASHSALDGNHNMTAPFEKMKKLWHTWIDDHVDHTLQLGSRDPLIQYFQEHEADNVPYLLVTPGDPTTEVMAALFYAKATALIGSLNLGLSCTKVILEETPTNHVVFSGIPDDVINRDHYPLGADKVPWWHRADMDINDLA